MFRPPRPGDGASRALLGTSTCAISGLLFLILLLAVVTENAAVRRIDEWIADELNAWVRHRPGAASALNVIGEVTAPVTFHVIVFVVAVGLWRAGTRRSAVWAVATMAAGATLNVVLKVLVARARPAFDDPVATADHYSFPSGHALNSAVAAGVVLLVLRPYVSGRGRALLAALAFAVVAVTGFDRVGLGVHYASDVLAGWFEAVVLLSGAVLAFGPDGVRRTRANEEPLPRVDIPTDAADGATDGGPGGSVDEGVLETAAMTFRDRDDAGRRLAERLSRESWDRPVVLALPRGGVPVAAHVANRLGAPLEVFVARKIGAPDQPEFGIGAIAESSDEIVDTGDAVRLGIDATRMNELAAAERTELTRRVRAYRGSAALPELEGRDVVLVDDGLATGVTAEAALRALRRHRPRRLVLAVPVCPPETAMRLEDIADAVMFVESHRGLGSIGAWYENFTQTTDDEVVDLLAAGRPHPAEISLPEGGSMSGDLVVPPNPIGAVLFAHGTGSSRRSPRNRNVANVLRQRGLATLLMDLLTANEARQDAATGGLRFDIDLLAERLDRARAWLSEQPGTGGLPVGLFGASTGAAAALVCAARSSGRVDAVVSRGGRPDLAGAATLRHVTAPTLLIVGGRDEVVLDLNRQALGQLGGPKRLEVVDGAGHLFEEPGALDTVARLTGDWLSDHLARRPAAG